MASSHSWEVPDRAWDREIGPVDVPPDWDDVEGGSDDEADLSILTEEECQEEFSKMLTEHYFAGKLSARSTCVIAYWAQRSGLRGPAVELAMPPTSASGHFQRHLDKALGLKAHDEKLCKIVMPCYSKHSACRDSREICVLPPHEVLYEEVQQQPSMRDMLQQKIDTKEWANVYANHRVVLDNPGEEVYPIALFVDGVPFTQRDSLLAFYSYNLLTGIKHLNAVLRKSQICRCGCRGWCTVSAVFRFLAWSFSCLASGTFPANDAAGNAFTAKDGDRFARSGQTLGFRGAVVQVKGDCAEFSHSFGFASWKSNQFP